MILVRLVISQRTNSLGGPQCAMNHPAILILICDKSSEKHPQKNTVVDFINNTIAATQTSKIMAPICSGNVLRVAPHFHCGQPKKHSQPDESGWDHRPVFRPATVKKNHLRSCDHASITWDEAEKTIGRTNRNWSTKRNFGFTSKKLRG